ncbi:class I SAM-dependent methyltransferase [Marinimicrobium sp. ARAG 43.8]|uniref:class I SAM-dependent methyltransferase n=1 Tax=Marinimicrobium sp. ARAG 43.8 TaxID=3418719 RepID=UPI003CEE68F2
MRPSSPFNRAYRWWQRHFGLPELSRSQTDLSAWFHTPLGETLLAQEREALDQRLQDRFGYHLLQMSVTPELDVSAGSRIAHRVTVGACIGSVTSTGAVTGTGTGKESVLSGLMADHRQLPLPGESIDMVVLHHALDYCENPHQLLREVQRVLIPRGHLIILGFNPWSGLGGVRGVARLFSTHAVWHHRALRLGRLLDWLPLLDLVPDSVEQGFFRPPVNSPGLMRRTQWLETWGKRFRLPGGAFYVVVACKEVGGAVPLKPPWENADKGFRGLGGVQPLNKTQKAARSNS